MKKYKDWELLECLPEGWKIDKHDCRENGKIVEKLPLLEGDSYMSPPKYYIGDTYNLKCNVCGNSWWQNYP